MKILISNDDGYQYFGIKLLYQIAYEYFNNKDDQVFVVCPKQPQSCMSTKLSVRDHIYFEEHKFELINGQHLTGFLVDGSPVDCCRFGIEYYKPDLVLSGINQGLNSGFDTHYSGTLGVCKNAAFQNIPSIAFSNFNIRETFEQAYERLKPTVIQVFKQFTIPILKQQLQQHCILNVNFPSYAVKGFKQARLAPRLVYDFRMKINVEDGVCKYIVYQPNKTNTNNDNNMDVNTCNYDKNKLEEDIILLQSGYATYTFVSLDASQYYTNADDDVDDTKVDINNSDDDKKDNIDDMYKEAVQLVQDVKQDIKQYIQQYTQKYVEQYAQQYSQQYINEDLYDCIQYKKVIEKGMLYGLIIGITLAIILKVLEIFYTIDD